MSTELSTLVDLIANQVRTIEDLCSPKQETVPSVDDVGAVSPDVMKDPGFVQAADVAIAAATRLIAMLRDPIATLYQTASGMYGSALLNVVVETGITEALKEAGPKGLHVRELAPKVGMDPVKLARVLRYLSALHYVYREVEPDVFTNNRVSIALDTHKSFDEVKDRASSRYIKSKGCAAFIGHETDECLKGAAQLSSNLLDPTTAFSSERSKSATMRAFGYGGTWFEWLGQPEQKKRLDRYDEAVSGLQNELFPKECLFKQFPWDELPAGSIVVDIEGEISSCTLPLARAYPDLRFVAQVQPSNISDAEEYLKEVSPDVLESGLIKLQARDIFEDQPIEDAAVFLLCLVLHNRSDLHAAQILRHLSEVATEDTKLIIVDPVVPYSCSVKGDIASQNVPEALRGNVAAHHGLPYIMDLQMMNLTNSQERTIGQWASLIKACGWDIEAIHPGIIQSIICSPAP